MIVGYSEVKLHDPVMLAGQATVGMFRTCLMSFVAERKRSSRRFEKAYDELLQFSDTMNYSLPPACSSNLEYLIDHFAEFEELRKQVEAAAVDPVEFSATIPKRILGQLENTQLAMATLKEYLTTVTAPKLALQGHFQNFVAVGPEPLRFGPGEMQRLYSPLSELRDEYFTTPKSGHITEYLRRAETVRTNPDYVISESFALSHSRQQAEKKLASNQLSLEVFSMLDVLDGE
jgi:hypothetical protein